MAQDDQSMSTSEAGRRGAEAQPTEAKRKGGEHSAQGAGAAGDTDAARRGGEHSHSGGNRSDSD